MRDLLLIADSGILMRAKREGLIGKVRPLLFAMRTNGYYLSDRVIQYACRMAAEEEG